MEPEVDRGRPHGFLRRLFRRADAGPVRAPEAMVVAFASGKGGTGKSFTTTNVAVALHRLGRRVVVVDCDFALANAHLLFGVNPRWTMHHLLDGAMSVQEVLLPTPHGPSLVAGGSGIASLAELGSGHMELLARAMRWLACTHDVVLLDCAAGLAPPSLITVLAAQHAVVVTNPEIAALTDAYALVKCLARQPSCPHVHLVVNRVLQPGMGRTTFERLADVSRRFASCELHYLGEVPEDPAVTQRRLGQPPILVSHPECAISMAIQTLTRTLDERAGGLRARQSMGEGVQGRMMEQVRRW